LTKGIFSTANAVWIATALLHKENPSREGIYTMEIFKKVKELYLCDSADSTIKTHISHHCVANAKPSPNAYRYLYRLSNGWYRLFKRNDNFHIDRENGKILPLNLSEEYKYLLQWYYEFYNKHNSNEISDCYTPDIFVAIPDENNLIKIPTKVLNLLNYKKGDIFVFTLALDNTVIMKKACT